MQNFIFFKIIHIIAGMNINRLFPNTTILTPKDIGLFLGFSEATVRKWCKDGLLIYSKQNNRILIKIEEFQAFIERAKVKNIR